VKVPIAISPYYNNQTTEGFEDPKLAGDRIPDYKAITLRSVIATTPGEVLIAGLDDAHRTEVTLDGVRIDRIAPEQVHGRFATVTLGPHSSNISFIGTDVKVIPSPGAQPVPSTGEPPFSCVEKFVPME
jgi:polygalacturonase